MHPIPTMNADLHCHSNVSDGALTPAEVAQRAHAARVTLWALTDHDEVGGQLAAREAAQALGMRYVCGVEISVTWASRTVHVVGLNVDPAAPALVDGLYRTRNGRAARALEMGERLAEIGIPGAYEGALRYVSNPDLISRTHFARYLVEAGHAASTSEVFARYLGDGKPGCVPHRWARLDDAVGWIQQAGGEAVIAHPGRYATRRSNSARCSASSSTWAAARSRSSRAATRPTSIASTRRSPGATASRRRAVPISMRLARASSSSAACRRCRRT